MLQVAVPKDINAKTKVTARVKYNIPPGKVTKIKNSNAGSLLVSLELWMETSHNN